MSNYPVTSATGQRMLSYLPDYYDSSRVMRAKFQSTGIEFDQISAANEFILDQFFINTASETTLQKFEYEFGLPVKMDQPVDQRRSKILAQKRGYGPATTALIAQVGQSFENGIIEIIEDFPACVVIIKFVSTIGIPPGLEDIKAAINLIIPSHLQVQYQFNYLRWDEFDALNLTWDELDALNITWDQLEVYHE